MLSCTWGWTVQPLLMAGVPRKSHKLKYTVRRIPPIVASARIIADINQTLNPGWTLSHEAPIRGLAIDSIHVAHDS